MRALALLACAVVVSGCVSYRASKVTAIVGGAGIVAGIAFAAADPSTGETDGHAITNIEAASMMCLVGGLILGLSGVIGMVAHGGPTSQAPRR